MKLQELTLNTHHPNIDIQAIKYDSRQVQAGDLYVALKGTQTDGHLYIPEVIKKGAVVCIVSLEWFKLNSPDSTQCLWIPVNNPAEYMALLASRFYQSPSNELKMVGVTGTNGKTTISHLIHSLLNPEIPCGLIGTLGNLFQGHTEKTPYTTPFSPEMQGVLSTMKKRGAKVVALECSSHALEQHRLDAISIDIAIFSNLTQDHLDYHHNMESYAQAKSILFERLLSPKGLALIHLNDHYSDYFLKAAGKHNILTYGLTEEADIQAKNIAYYLSGCHFEMVYKSKAYLVKIQLPGEYNILNALAALAAVIELGMSPEAAISKIEKIPGVPGRLEVVSDSTDKFTVIVDYAHTPDSLDNVLRSIKAFTKNRIITVFGCGGDRDMGKRPLMGQIAEKWSDHLIITSDNPRTEDPLGIIHDIVKGLKAPHHVSVKADRSHAISESIQQAKAGDVILIAGKGHENYQVFKNETIHFDDREEARKHLKQERQI